MWHGTGLPFVLWGFWHGLLFAAERLVSPPRPKGAQSQSRHSAATAVRFLASHLYALAAVMFGWILFRSATLGAAGVVLRSLLGLAPLSRESRTLWVDCTPVFQCALAAGAVFSLPVVPLLRRALRRLLPDSVVWTLESLVVTVLGAAALFFLAGDTQRSFLYFKF
jgi:hypothetical protein